MSRPTFSLIIPSHNYAHFLPTTLDSIYQQGRADVEVILVDDASSDNTAGVVEGYPQVEYVRLDKNVGPGQAWAVGLERARGRYVAKLDADDWQLPGWFDKVEAAFAADERVGLVAGSAVLYYQDGDTAVERVTTGDRVLTADELRQKLLGHFFFRMPAMCLRAAILEGSPPPRHDLRLPHDWEYFIRVTRGWKGVLLHDAIAVYRIHGGSLTVTSKEEDRLLRDFDRMYEIVSDPTDPAYLPENERRTLAGGMATSYLGAIGPHLARRDLATLRHHLSVALSLARRGGPSAVATTLRYMCNGAWRRIRKKLCGGANARGDGTESLLPR